MDGQAWEDRGKDGKMYASMNRKMEIWIDREEKRWKNEGIYTCVYICMGI